MKEASGELNMTVITIVAIAAVAAFFYLLIWPTIQTSMALNTACNGAGSGSYSITKDSYTINCDGGTCHYYDEDGNETTKDCN